MRCLIRLPLSALSVAAISVAPAFALDCKSAGGDWIGLSFQHQEPFKYMGLDSLADFIDARDAWTWGVMDHVLVTYGPIRTDQIEPLTVWLAQTGFSPMDANEPDEPREKACDTWGDLYAGATKVEKYQGGKTQYDYLTIIHYADRPPVAIYFGFTL